MSLLIVGVVVVLALLVGWRWVVSRRRIDQSVSETWLQINGRDQGKGGSR